MNILKFWERKQTPVWQIIVAGKEGSAVWSKINKAEAARIYSRIDTVFSCIDMIAGACAQAEFKAVSKKADGTKVESFDHPALELLNRPAPNMSQQDLIYSHVAWKLISGDSYLFFNNGDDANFRKPPTELNCLRSDRMKIIPGDAGILAYEYELGGLKRRLPVDQISGASNVMHSKFFNPTDDFYGMALMEAAHRNIDIYESALKWNKSLLDNSCRPSGMFFWTGEGTLGEEQRAQMKKMLDDHTGPDNAGKPLIGGGKIDFKQLSLSPKDVEFLAAKEMTMKDIARVFKLPPILLNIGSDSTFTNMKEAKLSLWDDTVIPQMSCLVNELNNTLMPRYPGSEMLELDLANVTALEPRRESQWERARTADFLTINERRNIVGYEDVDEGDDIMVPASSVPLAFAAGDFGSSEDGQKKKLIG